MNYESQSVYRPVPDAGENISFTNSNVQSSALRGGIYSLSSDQACYIKLGTSPTASVASGSMRIPANTLLYIKVNNGEEIAVVRETTNGTLNIQFHQ